MKQLVKNYVPSEFQSFYDSITGCDDVTLETEESECD